MNQRHRYLQRRNFLDFSFEDPHVVSGLEDPVGRKIDQEGEVATALQERGRKFRELFIESPPIFKCE